MLSFRLHMEFTSRTCDEAASALRSLVGPVRSESGCSATRLLMGTEDGNKLTWVEEWRSVEDFEQHLRGRLSATYWRSSSWPHSRRLSRSTT